MKAPEQYLTQEKPEVLAEGEVIYQEILHNYNLSKLREEMNKTQVELANALGIKQPAVA